MTTTTDTLVTPQDAQPFNAQRFMDNLPSAEEFARQELEAASQPVDAGTQARDRLKLRAAARKSLKILRWTLFSLVLLALAAASAFGYWAWNTRVTGYTQDTRTCQAVIGKTTLTGFRTFSYPFTDILGFRFIDKSNITESTRLDIKGDAITIVGAKDDKWWAIPIGMGERGNQLLKPAATYTFVINNKEAGVVEYGSFCR